jgi:hypothetical protein
MQEQAFGYLFSKIAAYLSIKITIYIIMNIIKQLLIMGVLTLFYSCGPYVNAISHTSFDSLPVTTFVTIIPVENSLAVKGKYVGTLQLGDNGLTVHCSYSQIHNRAKLEALKMGGDIVKIIELKRPNLLSSCFRLNALVYKSI